jgi:murein DD-endopeptidase MepM/ murein hydrolase activator NlpD
MRAWIRTLLLAVVLVAGWPLLQPVSGAVRIVAQRPPAVLEVPVAGVARAALRDSWHAPRGNGRRHEGIDIFAARGTVVRANVPGIVWNVGQNRLGGNVVWLLGPGLQLHYYAHLDEFADIATGEFVAAGTPLGSVGTTGNARGGPPHLHYGIYTAHGPVNPFPRLGRQ